MPRKIRFAHLLLVLFALTTGAAVGQGKKSDASHNASQKDNVLTEKERKEGWKLLFDGKTTKGWRGAYKTTFPDSGWVAKDGVLSVLPSGGRESRNGGDIVTVNEYDNFEFTADFKLTEGANSGIKYFVVEHQPKPEGSAFGLEFQVLDDARHPDAKLGKNGNRTAGSLYDLIAAKDKQVNPIGQWNNARIVVQGKHVEHWLNGKKVVEYERGNEEYRQAVAGSKYATPQYNKNGRFGEASKGHLLLQDHGDAVSYKNVKIRTLPASS
ncbi:MAG: DUF1080 domain-containing protein [Ferruginibacter sp.]|nr:DUF1080 domain-containing protein [Cytophagales bacterium]